MTVEHIAQPATTSAVAFDPAQVATGFFAERFGDQLDADHLIVIWTLPDKRTRFFDSIDAAAEYAMSRADDADVYFGVNLYRPGIKHGRGCNDDVTKIIVLVADLDADDVDRATVLAAIASLPRQPTVIVSSGGGYHLYYRLREPITPGDPDFKTIGKRLVDGVRALTGFGDAVGDPARVLRVPGTFNHKTGTPRPVTIMEDHPDA